ncbi:hypothetical protein Q5P01_000902 [Channa striata]|uniref:Uncharacterized protein n=1 Tax=Channa striata TaxID=64152 RepID=A0AA88LFI7_CHASR|nr:hypothetical protein Q5P01_000902 [Channa striata]
MLGDRRLAPQARLTLFRLSALYLSSLSSAALKSGGLGLGRVQVDHAPSSQRSEGLGDALHGVPAVVRDRPGAHAAFEFELDGRARASSTNVPLDSRLPRALANSPQRCLPFRAYYHDRHAAWQGRHRGRLRLSDLHRKELFAASCPLRPPILSARFRGKLGAHSRDHLSDPLITLGCLAMVVSIVLSFFAATSKRKMDDSRRGAEQEHPHRVRLSHRDERRAVHVRAAGCMELLYRPLIQDEHRLHNMECAIAVFNIAIYAMYVVTMVLTPTVLKEKQDEVRAGSRKDATEIAIAPNSSRQPLLLQQQGQWESLLFAIQRVHVNGERVAYRVIESAGAIELFRKPACCHSA